MEHMLREAENAKKALENAERLIQQLTAEKEEKEKAAAEAERLKQLNAEKDKKNKQAYEWSEKNEKKKEIERHAVNAQWRNYNEASQCEKRP